MPQSIGNICPEIDAALSDSKNSAMSATSSGDRNFFKGCLSVIFSIMAWPL